MSSQINTAEVILQINETNDKIVSLDKVETLQKINGVDLLREYHLFYGGFEEFDKLYPDEYTDEMKEYKNALSESGKIGVVQKYDGENHVVNQPVQNRPSKFAATTTKSALAKPKYETMYKDNVCKFFIGSISVVSLYILFRMIK